MSLCTRSIPRWSYLLPTVLLMGCARTPAPKTPTNAETTVKVLATTDVHGWLNGTVDTAANRFEGGLAELGALWQNQEGYDPAKAEFLVLDSGDMWTGPPESTMPKGLPLVEAFNAIGYDAAVIGNHEFDFGLEILRRNAKALKVPLLAANLDRAADGPELDFFQRSRIVDVGGLKAGVIGLACKNTPRMSFPKAVAGLVFEDYEPAIRTEAGKLMKQGADFLVIMAHDSLSELRPVVERTADLPIRLVLGGHNHQMELEVLDRDPSTKKDDVILMTAGRFARSYGKTVLTFKGTELTAHTEEVLPVAGDLAQKANPPHPVLGPLAQQAAQAVAEQMQVVAGKALTELPAGGDNSPLGELVADSWRVAFPEAQASIVNWGGIRQSLPAGPITVGDVYGVLPFDNELLLVRLSGVQLREVLANRSTVISGIRFRYTEEGETRRVTFAEFEGGQPILDDATYTVLTTDFLYYGGDGFPFKTMDTQPRMLGVNWREPFLTFIRQSAEAGLSAPTEIRRAKE